MKVSVKKPGSPSEVLEHSGVKGMSWGVRRAATKSAGREAAYRTHKEALVRGTGPRRAGVEARRAGRTAAKDFSRATRAANPNVAARQAFKTNFPTSKSKASEINRARAEVTKAKQKFERETDPVKKAAAREAYVNHPDRATALRVTRGEKVALGLLTGVFGVASPVGLGVGIGTGIRVSRRRREERRAAGL